MKNKIRFSIRYKYITGLIIIILLLIIIFMFLIPQIYKELLNNEEDKIKLYNKNTANNLNNYFSIILNDMEFLSSLEEIKKFNFIKINQILSSAIIKKKLIDNFFISDNKGKIKYFLKKSSIVPDDITNKYYYKEISKADTSNFYYDYSEESKKFFLIASTPIINNGKTQGYIFGIIDINDNDILNNSIINPPYYEWQIMITNNKGFLIYHSDVDLSNLEINKRDFSDFPSVKSALLGKYDMDTVNINNLQWYTVSEKISTINWFAIVQIPKKIVTDKIKNIVMIYSAILFLIAIIIIIVAVFLSNKIIKPLESLSHALNDFAENKKISKIKYNWNDEIKDIINTFYKMTDERIMLEKAIQEISEQERLRIGQDLHDDLGQILTGISFQLIIIEQELSGKLGSGEENLNEIKELLTSAINKTRFISKGLYPVELYEHGIIFALKELTDNIIKIYKIDCSFDYDDNIKINDRSKEINIYRITQEFINNSLKHGEADQIVIKIKNENNKIRFSCSDNGKGFDYEKVTKGIGLKSMQYRANLLNALYDLNSILNKGTFLNCLFDP